MTNVIPGVFSPQQQPKVNRNGLSEDFTGFTGYPQGSAGAPPALSQPPMSAYSHSPYSSHSGSSPYLQPGPALYPNFNAQWASNGAQNFPPQAFSPFPGFGPPPSLAGPPPPMHPPQMGGPPPQMRNIPQPQQMNGQGHPPWQGGPGPGAYPPFYAPELGQWAGQLPHLGQPQQQYRVPPEPPAPIFDRMNPFTEGRSCTSILFYLFKSCSKA